MEHLKMNCAWEMQDQFRCFGIGIFHELFIEIGLMGLMDESWGYRGIFTTDGCEIHPSSVASSLFGTALPYISRACVPGVLAIE